LAEAACILFVLPGVGPTIDKEIKWLQQQRMLSKCVFIMPETITDNGVKSAVTVPSTVKITEYRAIDHRGDWATAQTTMQSLGLNLPGYQPEGALFSLDDTGQVKSISPLRLARTLLKVRRLRKALHQILGV